MRLNEYQQKAMTTCTESSYNLMYMHIGLTAEVGEINDKIAKAIRKEWIKIDKNNIVKLPDCPSNFEEELMKEVGDGLWFIAGLCEVMGWSLEDVAQMNLDKLQARKQAGTIVGNGDGIEREV